ncbi:MULTISPECIES: hypothetical protein [Bacteroides]|nr:MULTISPECIES: hypothetical protein [Bacteroides]NVK92117.1 hypothetical protein [Bacteroides sp. L10-4]
MILYCQAEQWPGNFNLCRWGRPAEASGKRRFVEGKHNCFSIPLWET